MVETYILKINRNLNTAEIDHLLPFVTAEKVERIQRFYRIEDRQRCLLGDVLARYALCKRLEMKNNALSFKVNPYGKPLLDHDCPIHFNISHSGNWVACAVADAPTGIDVELIQPIDLNIAERFFSKEEHEVLISQPVEEKLLYFYKLWTLKESYVKAEGKGLSIPLDSFTMKIGHTSIEILLQNAVSPYSCSLMALEHDAMAAICTADEETKKEFYIDIDSFLEELSDLQRQGAF